MSTINFCFVLNVSALGDCICPPVFLAYLAKMSYLCIRKRNRFLDMHITYKSIIKCNRMKRQFLWLCVSLFLLAVPVVQTFAFDEEVEIVLLEVSGFLPGDNPFDDHEQDGNVPPQPNDFRATITGSNLAVTVTNTHAVNLTVRNASGNTVVSRQFVGGTMEQLPSGVYSIELNSGSLTLVGAFVAL